MFPIRISCDGSIANVRTIPSTFRPWNSRLPDNLTFRYLAGSERNGASEPESSFNESGLDPALDK